jgi:serine/threonine-protein kinase
MASVRRVRDRNLMRTVAMKVLAPAIATRPHEAQRFLEEAQITGQLDHPYIPPVHEVGIDEEGTHYFTMKYVRGQTLEELLDAGDDEALGEERLFEALQIFVKICQALSFAHSRGVIHCDIKPRNIMVGSHGQVYVMDWGIARLIDGDRTDAVALGEGADRDRDEGRVLGTARWMSPEQAQGRNSELDQRTDVFQLGALLYRIMTGFPPYPTETSKEALALAKECRWTPPEELAPERNLPRRLCSIAQKALAKSPEDRYQSVEALQAEVETFMRGVGRHRRREVAAGELIIEEGSRGDEAYVVLRGKCRAFKVESGEKRVLREMGPNSVFGEAAIFAATPRTASVEAVEATTLIVVTRESLNEEVGTVAGPFVKTLAERFAEVDGDASRLRGQIDEVRMLRATLDYFAFEGVRKGDQLVGSWSALYQHLRTALGLPKEQVLEGAARISGLRVDAANDRAVLTRG